MLSKKLITRRELNYLARRCNALALRGERNYPLVVAELPRLLMAARIGIELRECLRIREDMGRCSEFDKQWKRVKKLIAYLED